VKAVGALFGNTQADIDFSVGENKHTDVMANATAKQTANAKTT
jgi:hypothetical protein